MCRDARWLCREDGRRYPVTEVKPVGRDRLRQSLAVGPRGIAVVELCGWTQETRSCDRHDPDSIVGRAGPRAGQSGTTQVVTNPIVDPAFAGSYDGTGASSTRAFGFYPQVDGGTGRVQIIAVLFAKAADSTSASAKSVVLALLACYVPATLPADLATMCECQIRPGREITVSYGFQAPVGTKAHDSGRRDAKLPRPGRSIGDP